MSVRRSAFGIGPPRRSMARVARLAVRPSVLAMLVAGLATACGGSAETDGIACTTEVRTSVIVHVVDEAGAPLAGATVRYRVDGGLEQAATCHQAPATCTDFQAGQELSGVFSITAQKPGFLPASANVRVERDACHVQTQQLALTLRAV